jgi:hypothetical protein
MRSSQSNFYLTINPSVTILFSHALLATPGVSGFTILHPFGMHARFWAGLDPVSMPAQDGSFSPHLDL